MIAISETRDHKLIASLNEEVHALHCHMHPEFFKPFDKAGMGAAFQSFFTDANCRAYVATKDGIAIGYIICMVKEVKENAFIYASKSLYIDQVGVLQAYRHTGAGRLLMAQAEQLAHELSIKRIELDHWSANTVAAGYFRKHGYALCKERLFKTVG